MRCIKKLSLQFAIIGSLCGMQLHNAWSQEAHQSLLIPGTVRSENLSLFPKWIGMMERYKAQAAIRYQPCNAKNSLSCALDEWKSMLAAQRGKPFAAQLEAINNFGNTHPYIVDQVNWGVTDYWETPIEFLDVSGDCEDYAIFKYYSLRALGIPASRLRIMVVQDLNLGGIVHAILSVSQAEENYVLDNQIKQVVSAGSIYHYKPIYSINETSWWLYPPQ